MAIDTSIYGQIRQPEIESPVNALARVTQLKNAQNQNRLFDMKVAESEREQASQNALSEAYRNAYRPDGSLDEQGLIANLAQGGQGSRIPGIQKGLADSKKASADAMKSQLDAAGRNAEIVGQYMTAAKQNPSLYPQILTQLREMIPGGGKDLPDQFDPAVVDATISRAMSVKDQVAARQKELDYQLDQQKFGEAKRSNRVSEGIAGGNLSLRRQELAAGGKAPAGYRWKPDGTMEAIPGGPADAKLSKEGSQKINDAKDVLGLLDEVDALLPKATSGALGAGIDMAAGAFGHSPEGATATAQLKALQGALISKMPKMSGPQSDKDVQLYREMAGQVADPLVPRKQRQAASKTIRSLNEKYAGMEAGSSNPSGGVIDFGSLK